MRSHRKAFLGGTFNPIHYGHLRMAEEVREALNLDKVVFIPSSIPPLKTEDVAPADLRLQMLRIALKDNPFFEISDIECRRSGKSYTVDTIKIIREEEPDLEPIFILGIDAFLEMPLWHRPDELIKLCDFAVVKRSCADFKDLSRSPFLRSLEPEEKTDSYRSLRLISGRRVFWIECTVLDISASDIRQRLREGRSIKYLLPESVESFIISNQIYFQRERGG
jgi:nicotinate-nucleotide adenylyltransferase